MGAEALKELLEKIDLDQLSKQIRKRIRNMQVSKRKGKLIKKIRYS